VVVSPLGEVMENQRNALLIYDGECPFCSRYVQMLRLRDSIDLQLLDARLLEKGGGAQVLHEVITTGFDLNEGMVLKLDQEFYHGDQCIYVLALLSSSVGWSNRCFAVIFRSHAAARILYPVLRFFRNLTLRCLRRKKLDLGS